ncbi:PREDICTED: hemK methyltransferase family member 2-like [Trachymyrmex cornetzi]|uniref:Methyltransferase HEMK2 n=1 Tax=Trachymyrmex cornetzi TaxID=471704 RepID=A0A195EFW5_9HYME|nr:PREDICTED: hemK methyltransferase family member 2-like [Trachymyrmex cornetzi]KYN27133.1 HemK methyltransferase family member 2 [Trachymyrmex cornetzi]
METPIVKLSDEELNTVYEPSEDSYLLVDALEADLEILHAMKPRICLEIGSGSGIVITALAMALKKRHNVEFIAIDINPDACRATRRTSLINSVDVDVLQMNLLDCIRIKYTFDIILFNPPYVVTEYNEVIDDRLVFKTWAGGKNGRQVMEQVFAIIPKILSDAGLFYLVIIKENNPEYILSVFKKLNMSGEIVHERKVRGEHLYILRFRK